MENTGRVEIRKKDARVGVITGVPMSVTIGDLMKNIKGVKFVNFQRMKTTGDGEVNDTETVSIEFVEEILPKKVYLGFMSYSVRMLFL